MLYQGRDAFLRILTSELEPANLEGYNEDMNVSIDRENSSEPSVHSRHMQKMLADLIEHLRKDADRVQEPRFQALLETSAEVLTGLKTAFAHYDAGKEPAWKR
jgi:hypothetical protein